MTTTMTVVKDEWVRAAMTDDNVVVELLFRLKQAQAAPPVVNKCLVATLRWGIRQPRSRSFRRDDVSHKKGADSATNTRDSPTTPLSWSGGCAADSASPSATVDGFEETSCQVAGSRSKVPATNETTSTTTKRSRKKKTYAELKEEESMLLKERIYLKKEIATLHATFKEHRTKNENLKRMKLDLNMQHGMNFCSTSDEMEKEISGQPHQRVASSLDQFPSTLQRHASVDDHLQSDSCETEKAASSQDSFFLLPDLNMMPSEDDSGTETLYDHC